MRTPLKTVRHLGSAKEGTDHFWKQRLTALANVPLLLAFIGIIFMVAGSDYDEARDFMSGTCPAIVMALLIVSGFTHMKLGMQVIIEDYIHAEGLKIGLLILNTFFCLTLGAASLLAVLKLSFGA